MKPTHHIADLHLDLCFETDDPRPQPISEDDLLAMTREHILSALAEALEQEDDGRHRRIARLDIDLGECAAYNYAEEIPPLLARLLREALAAHDTDTAGAWPARTAAGAREPLEHFLLTGLMPSSLTDIAAAGGRAPHEQLLAHWLAAPAGNDLNAMLRRCATSPGVVRRLAQQFESGTLRQLVQRLETPATAALWLSLVDDIDGALPPADSSRAQHLRQFWEFLLHGILGGATISASISASATLRQAAAAVASTRVAATPPERALLRAIAIGRDAGPAQPLAVSESASGTVLAPDAPPAPIHAAPDRSWGGLQSQPEISLQMGMQGAGCATDARPDHRRAQPNEHPVPPAGNETAPPSGTVRGAVDQNDDAAVEPAIANGAETTQSVQARIDAALAAANAGLIHADWEGLLRDHSPLLRAALLRYGGLDRLAERSPASIIGDLAALLTDPAVRGAEPVSAPVDAPVPAAHAAATVLPANEELWSLIDQHVATLAGEGGVLMLKSIQSGAASSANRQAFLLGVLEALRSDQAVDLEAIEAEIASTRHSFEREASVASTAIVLREPRATPRASPIPQRTDQSEDGTFGIPAGTHANALTQALPAADAASLDSGLSETPRHMIVDAMRKIGTRGNVWRRVAHLPPAPLMRLVDAAVPQAALFRPGRMAARTATAPIAPEPIASHAPVPAGAHNQRPAGHPLDALHPREAVPPEILRQALLEADSASVGSALDAASGNTVLEAMRQIGPRDDIWLRIARFAPDLLMRMIELASPQATHPTRGTASAAPASTQASVHMLASAGVPGDPILWQRCLLCLATTPFDADAFGNALRAATLAIPTAQLAGDTVKAAPRVRVLPGSSARQVALPTVTRPARSDELPRQAVDTASAQQMLGLDEIEEHVQSMDAGVASNVETSEAKALDTEASEAEAAETRAPESNASESSAPSERAPDVAAPAAGEPYDGATAAPAILRQIERRLPASGAASQRMLAAISMHAARSPVPATYLQHVLEDIMKSRTIDLEALDMLYDQPSSAAASGAIPVARTYARPAPSVTTAPPPQSTLSQAAPGAPAAAPPAESAQPPMPREPKPATPPAAAPAPLARAAGIVHHRPAYPRRPPGGELARALARHAPARRAALTAMLRHADDDLAQLPLETIQNVVKLLAGTHVRTMARYASDVRALAAQHLPHLPPTSTAFETARFELDWFFIQGKDFTPDAYAHGLAAWLGRHVAATAAPLHEALHNRLGMPQPPVQTAPPAAARTTGIARIAGNGMSGNSRAANLGEMDVEIDALLVDNAGQVLIGPYMPRLFAMLGLTDAGRFKDAEAAERAVHLLQCVVGAPSNTPEAMLGLNKILCGVPAATAIAREITITDHERDTVEMMLRAIIEHWKKIGNTTPDGLRQSFLRRTGRMHLKDDAWHLNVDPGTFDMLLDSLPWSFSIIKHPWMERAVHVNWR